MMMSEPRRPRAPRNRTLTLSEAEREELDATLLRPRRNLSLPDLEDRLIHGDIFDAAKFLPENFVDLLILDPPYSIAKQFNGRKFSALGDDDYLAYLESWLPLLVQIGRASCRERV